MNRSLITVTVVTLTLALVRTPLRAQLFSVVYDPTNYAEAVLQYEQLVRQYTFLVQQARRVPVDIASRYHAHSIDWTNHNVVSELLYATPLLTALNEGDASGRAYASLVETLDRPTDVLERMPTALRTRLGTAYAAVELADSISRLAVDQSGSARVDGPFTLQAIRNVEHDIANPSDDFHTHTALLQKINAAAAIELRVGEQTNQFLLSTLEQLLLENKRKRDTEAKMMNATIYQWRFGQLYGADLFHNTATAIDNWRPY